MTLRELIVARRSALCARWLDAILAEYGEETAARWRRQRDPFANPFRHALESGLPALLDAALGDGDPPAAAAAALEVIVRIRSIQELAPSRAAGFPYLLREVVRAELAAELRGGAHRDALAELDRRLERLVALSFDLYVRCREQVFRLRQDELRRSVASILRRWHGSDPSALDVDVDVVKLSPPPFSRSDPR